MADMRSFIRIVEHQNALCEGVIKLFDPALGMTYVVEKNPSKARYEAIIRASEHSDFKGIVTDESFFVWPAAFAHHHQIAHLLGLENFVSVVVGGSIIAGIEADRVRRNPHIRYLGAGVHS